MTDLPIRFRLRAFTLPIVLLSLAASVAPAADWPQWRGPNRDGRAPDTGLLQSWPEGGPPLAWRSKGLGNGYSSVAVAGSRIYTMGDIGDEQYVIAVSREDGSPVWKTAVGPHWNDKYLGSRATPTVDGDRVYAMSTEGTLVCLDAADGKLVWKRDVPKDFGGALMQAGGKYDWKWSESPLVDGDRVLVTPGVREAALVALDRSTGKEIWRAAISDLGEKGTDGAAYSSPVISEGGGVRQVVQFIGRGVIGVEVETGRYLWGYNPVANDVANIPTPIVDGDHVFVTSGYQTGAALLKLKRVPGGEDAPDGVKAEEVYFLEHDTMQNHHGGVILDRGTIYTGTGHNKGFPLAVRMRDGGVAWGPERNRGRDSAAIAYADGHLYLRYQNGLMILAEATPEAYREKGSFMIPDVEHESWAHPVVSDGRLYLREQDHLLVYDLRKP